MFTRGSKINLRSKSAAKLAAVTESKNQSDKKKKKSTSSTANSSQSNTRSGQKRGSQDDSEIPAKKIRLETGSKRRLSAKNRAENDGENSEISSVGNTSDSGGNIQFSYARPMDRTGIKFKID